MATIGTFDANASMIGLPTYPTYQRASLTHWEHRTKKTGKGRGVPIRYENPVCPPGRSLLLSEFCVLIMRDRLLLEVRAQSL